MADNDIYVDVRPMPCERRHQTVFSGIEKLDVGQAFVITNDHDPAPLGYQIRATFGHKFGWEYLQKGPEAWQVAIRRNH